MQLTFHAGASEQITQNVISASPGLSTVPSMWWEVEKCLQMNGWTDGLGQMHGWMDGWVEGGTLPAFGEAKAWSVGRVRKATIAEHFCMPGIPPAPFRSAISAARVPADRAVSSPGCGRPSSEPLRSLSGTLNTRCWLCH